MNNADRQIVEAYEVESLTPEQIASDLGYDPTAVSLSLAQYSPAYQQKNKELVKADEKPLFDDVHMNRARDVMVALTMNTDSPQVQYQAAKFIINEKKGRNDLGKLKSIGISVTVFNEGLAKAMAIKEQVKLRALNSLQRPATPPPNLGVNSKQVIDLVPTPQGAPA